MALLSLLSVSCGIIDMEIDEGGQIAYDMHLNHDTVYVMVGDTFVLEPVFFPDSVSNRELLFLSEDESVVALVNDTVIAMAEGETSVVGLSVHNGLSDTCMVYVMAPWVLNANDYSDDMVVYATATINGKPFDPAKMSIAAFAGSEMRGKGEVITIGDKQLLRFRIYSYLNFDSDMSADPEYIRFKCHDRENMTLITLPQYIIFDGETHGSPSEPVGLKN
jgi:hypothetical protein